MSGSGDDVVLDRELLELRGGCGIETAADMARPARSSSFDPWSVFSFSRFQSIQELEEKLLARDRIVYPSMQSFGGNNGTQEMRMPESLSLTPCRGVFGFVCAKRLPESQASYFTLFLERAVLRSQLRTVSCQTR